MKFGSREKYMIKTRRYRLLDFYSGNLKSKTCVELGRTIQKLKLVGTFAIAFTFALGGAMVHAQQRTKIARIGFLISSSPSAMAPRMEAFRQGLRELGYTEGKNISIEQRHADGKPDHLPDLAAELVRLNVDVIVTSGPTATRPTKAATSTIPIVMTFDDDPVGSGFVASLARPGGNVTGLSTLAPEIGGKRLELLKETTPRVGRVAVVGTSTRQGTAQILKEMESAASAMGIKVQYLNVQTPPELESAFQAASQGQAEAILLMQSPVFNSHRLKIADLASKRRLPAIYPASQYVEDGGLMSYGVNISDLDRRAAIYVDRILKGAKPADLPVEQPTKFDLVINLKAAKQIGLTIPPNVLARADKVIR
jgi:putative tryptophan/tyrosine transport system substrate-binding protein